MKLSNPIKLKKGIAIKSIDVTHRADINEETYHYVDEEDNPLYEDTESYVECYDIVKMKIGDDSDDDDMIFECECKHFDPVEFHEYLLKDMSKFDIVDFCFDFVNKFGKPLSNDRDTLDSLYYEHAENHSGWKHFNLKEPIRSAEISTVYFHFDGGWIDTIQIRFSDNDTICLCFNLDKYRKCVKKPISFFSFMERIIYSIEPRDLTGKEELFKRLVRSFGFVLDTFDADGRCIVRSYLSRVNENLSIFYVKSSNDLHGKFIPSYVNRSIADKDNIHIDDIKIYQDVNMVFEM